MLLTGNRSWPLCWWVMRERASFGDAWNLSSVGVRERVLEEETKPLSCCFLISSVSHSEKVYVRQFFFSQRKKEKQQCDHHGLMSESTLLYLKKRR